jgi:hypothetical protein
MPSAQPRQSPSSLRTNDPAIAFPHHAVAAASANLSADHVRLYKALGGGWQPEGSDAIGAASAETIGTSHQ